MPNIRKVRLNARALWKLAMQVLMGLVTMDDAKRTLGDQYGEWQTNFYGPMKMLQQRGRLLQQQAQLIATETSLKNLSISYANAFQETLDIQAQLEDLSAKINNALLNNSATARLRAKQKRYENRLNYYDTFDDGLTYEEVRVAEVGLEDVSEAYYKWGYRRPEGEGFFKPEWLAPGTLGYKKQKLAERIDRIEDLIKEKSPLYKRYSDAWYSNDEELRINLALADDYKEEQEAVTKQLESLKADIESIDNALVIFTLLGLW